MAKPVLFIDTETTGLGSGARVVQVAAIVSDGPESVRTRFQSLIKPDGWVIEEGAQAVHGISVAECAAYGIEAQVAAHVIERMRQTCGMIVAHNLAFDLRMIKSEYAAAKIMDAHFEAMPSYCTMLASKPLLKLPGKYNDYKWPKLVETYQYLFGSAFDGAHDAVADVEACMRVYWELKRREAAMDNTLIEARQ